MTYQIMIDGDADCFLIEGEFLRVDFDGEPDPHGGDFPAERLRPQYQRTTPLTDEAGNALYMWARHNWDQPDRDLEADWTDRARGVAKAHGWDGNWTPRR